jgi:UDP-3-O-[3-hydroxymyristoyl] N-acetylglucosamine deacetylase
MVSSNWQRQATLKRRVSLSGIGVHTGKPVRIALCPADPDSGIVFLRSDLAAGADPEIPARAALTGPTHLCTTLANAAGASVATVEHLLAAFSGLGVDNAVVVVDGPEIPVMDGSAAGFADAIAGVGLRRQGARRRVIRVRRPVRVEAGGGWAEFRPHSGRRFEIAISYDCPIVGDQSLAVELTPRRFRRDIARARTFGYVKDVERLWADGFALGASPENTVAIDNGAIVNPEGLRWPDEFVRHKALDAIGDIALAGAPIEGLYRSWRGGHRLNALALGALLADREAWSFESVERTVSPELGGRSAPLAIAFAGEAP